MKLISRYVYWLIGAFVLFSVVFAGIPIDAQAQQGPKDTPFPDDASANTTYKRYLPAVVKMNNLDLSFAGFEITQGIQTVSNTVPLIAGRSTVIRIYARSNKSAVNNVRISLRAQRGGANLAGSPLVVGPGTIPTTFSRNNLGSSYNVRLPTEWTSGTITIQATLDSSNAISENNEANNVTSFNLSFVAMPVLDIKVVPITFVDPDTGQTYPAASSTYLANGILRFYPLSNVRVSVRTGVTVNDCNFDSSNCWDSVLDRLTSLKSTDNAPSSQVYYGMVPLEDPLGRTWFYAGVAGMGWVNLRASLGLANSTRWGINGGEIAAHEIGHNLGRLHSPCGNPSGVDRSYPSYPPYQRGSIGEIGLEVGSMALRTPDIFTDIMGYCDNYWISTYTYTALQYALLNSPTTALTSRDSLLIRALLDGDTISQVEPAYSFNGIPAPADASSEFSVEFVDENEAVVSSYPLQVLEAEEPGIQVRRINSLVPLPEAPFASYRITRRGETLAVSKLEPPQPDAQADPAGVEVAGDTLRINWSEPSAPAVVRYSADNGQTWTTIGLDLIGGSLTIPRSELPEGNLRIEIILAGRAGTPMTLDWINQR